MTGQQQGAVLTGKRSQSSVSHPQEKRPVLRPVLSLWPSGLLFPQVWSLKRLFSSVFQVINSPGTLKLGSPGEQETQDKATLPTLLTQDHTWTQPGGNSREHTPAGPQFPVCEPAEAAGHLRAGEVWQIINRHADFMEDKLRAKRPLPLGSDVGLGPS